MTLGIYAQVNQSSRQEAIQKLEAYLFASNNSTREQGNLPFINEISVISEKDAEKK